MTHENTLPHCGTCVCGHRKPRPKYQDRFGDVWERASTTTVRRVSDGHIGGWFKGQGLKPLSLTEDGI